MTSVINVGKTFLSIAKGDITQFGTDAMVTAANSQLIGGGGVDGAIHRAAGPEMVKALKAFDGCPPGEARITRGYRLAEAGISEWVIHAVGPIYKDGYSGEAETLGNAYRSSLALCKYIGVGTITFPAISTGLYGYPLREAAQTAIDAVIGYVSEHQDELITHVRFVLFDDESKAIYEEIFKDYQAG